MRPIYFLILFTIALSLPAISAITARAQNLNGNNQQIGELQVQANQLNSTYQEALSQLVSVDSQVNLRNVEIQNASQQRDNFRVEIQAKQQRLEDLQRQQTTRQRVLENRLRSSYKSDDVGYLNVLLGAETFDEFLNRVEAINLIADEDRNLIESIRSDRQTLQAELESLDKAQGELQSLLDELEKAQESLLAAQAEQQQVVADLSAQMQNNGDQMARLQAQAAGIEARMIEIQTASYEDSSDGGYTPPPAEGSSLTATATAYCLEGTTATGMPAGHGIIAVDPGSIPLGSRVHVSGYGDAIAADTGGAIIGDRIDVWLPCNDAYAWGVRSVTVTIY